MCMSGKQNPDTRRSFINQLAGTAGLAALGSLAGCGGGLRGALPASQPAAWPAALPGEQNAPARCTCSAPM